MILRKTPLKVYSNCISRTPQRSGMILKKKLPRKHSRKKKLAVFAATLSSQSTVKIPFNGVFLSSFCEFSQIAWYFFARSGEISVKDSGLEP